MGLKFKNSMIAGVSITAGVGIEVAVVDYNRRLLLNYVSKPFVFDSSLRGNFDLDIFKETLNDALAEAGVPTGSEIVLNMPSCVFAVHDWPASIEKNHLSLNVEDDIFEHPAFSDSADDPIYSHCVLPNSTIQFNKVVYTAVPKNLVLEIALQIKDLKYKLVAIDTSVNSTLNALMYAGRVDVSPDTSWVMVQVDNNCCRIISMQGRCYVDCVEENVSIGEVLGDAENYGIILNSITPILNNTPSSLLYVISKTDVISAEVLASKISYKAPIVYQEVNKYSKTPLIDIAFDMDPAKAALVSLDVLGAAIKKDFGANSVAQLNLFNYLLGDIYLSQTPPVFCGIVLSMENMVKYGVIIALLIGVLAGAGVYFLNKDIEQKRQKVTKLNADVAQITKYLKDHEDVSSNQFSEIDELRIGISSNKSVFSYYTILGTEIPKKLWLTSVELGDNIVIKGQADNLESVYSFFRSIKDYVPSSPIKLQKLGLAGKPSSMPISDGANDDFDTESVLTSLNADFYEFVISDKPVEVQSKKSADGKDNGKDNIKNNGLPNLEPLE